MGWAREWAKRIDLRRAAPHGELVSSGYGLADPGRAYIVFAPDGGAVTIDLSALDGQATVEWLQPYTSERADGQPVTGGARVELAPPFDGPTALLLTAS